MEVAYPVDAVLSGNIPNLRCIALERRQEPRYHDPAYHDPAYHEASDNQT